MKDPIFVPSTLNIKCSASLQAEIEDELKLENINHKNIANLLKDEEENKQSTQKDQKENI
jgi:hypothetical protein